jgi:drug/metabolite transporter superfamily protein YnfA
VIGWSYAKPALYSAHAVVRAIGAFIIWVWIPDGRFTLIPFWVAATYLVTVAAILAVAKREAAKAAAAA